MIDPRWEITVEVYENSSDDRRDEDSEFVMFTVDESNGKLDDDARLRGRHVLDRIGTIFGETH